MAELNLTYHYQAIETISPTGEQEITVHEAFSTDYGELYMLSPIPVFAVGRSKEEITELWSMIERDIDVYPTINIRDTQLQIERYLENTESLPEDDDLNDLEDILNDEEILLKQDYHDKSGKVLDLVDFMKRKK